MTPKPELPAEGIATLRPAVPQRPRPPRITPADTTALPAAPPKRPRQIVCLPGTTRPRPHPLPCPPRPALCRPLRPPPPCVVRPAWVTNYCAITINDYSSSFCCTGLPFALFDDCRRRQLDLLWELQCRAFPDDNAIRQGELPPVFENSLGQPFVPVPGTRALMCLWETRVQDFDLFLAESGYGAQTEWRWPAFEQDGSHPVAGPSWHDANAFCHWLTLRERKLGHLAPDHCYRLPSDREWSCAVGLYRESGITPATRDTAIPGVYPWGSQAPVPAMAGNYFDESAHRADPAPRQWLQGYRDGFPATAPVASFPANDLGFHDLGGNVWEWTLDLYQPQREERTLRGASWRNGQAANLLSSERAKLHPAVRDEAVGFRLVLDRAPAREDEQLPY